MQIPRPVPAVAVLLVGAALAYAVQPAAAAVEDTWLFVPILAGPVGGSAALDAANGSDKPAIAAVVLLWDPAGCPPNAAGPDTVLCSGVIAPASSWTFPASSLAQATSAMVLSLDGASTAGDELIGQTACASLQTWLDENPDNLRRLRQAYENGDGPDTPVEGAIGPPLTATIRRSGAALSGGTVVHEAVARSQATTPLALTGLLARSAGQTDYVYVQNAGQHCAQVTATCSGAGGWALPVLAPGESAPLDVAACVGVSSADVVVTLGAAEGLVALRERYDDSVVETPLEPLDPTIELIPAPTPSRLAWLPALESAPDGVTCEARIQVTNPASSSASAVAVLVYHPVRGFCSPQSEGPVGIACSGLLQPGASWDFRTDAAMSPGRIHSATVHSFADGTLWDIGVLDRPDDLIGGAMCEAYFFDAEGDPDDYRRARLAFENGSAFGGVPQSQAVGPPLSVAVARTCALDGGSGEIVTSYGGLSVSGLTTRQPDGRYVGQVGGLAAGQGATSILYAQNAGVQCTGVRVMLSNGASCTETSLEAAGTVMVDVAECAGAPAAGLTATIESQEPLAIVVETVDPSASVAPLESLPEEVQTARLPEAAHSSWLPVLNYLGDRDLCTAVVRVENPASNQDPAAAILVAYGEPGFCPPQCAGPLKVECTGLIRPGGTWMLHQTQIPTGSAGGAVFSARTELLSDLGVSVAEDDVAAQLLCEILFYGAVGDCDDTRRFALAYADGGSWAGLPLAALVGPPLRVSVGRDCSPTDPTGSAYEYTYAAVGPAGLSALIADGSYRLSLEDLDGGPGNHASFLYLQNAGTACTTLELTFSNGTSCRLADLPPLETRFVDAGACAGEDAVGVDAVLTSSEPVAAVVEVNEFSIRDTVAPEELPTFGAVPSAPASALVHLPVLNTVAQEEVCEPAVRIVNPSGSESAMAILVEWTDSSPCRYEPYGPLQDECTGLIRPGGDWYLTGYEYFVSDAASGAVYSLTTRRLSEIGFAGGFDDIVGGYLCEALFFGVTGDETDYRAFRQAFESGGTFAGVDLARAVGPGLEVTVSRTCYADDSVRAEYAGIPLASLSPKQPDGTYRVEVADVVAGVGGSTSVVYVQNAGAGQARVTVSVSSGSVWPLPPLGAGMTFPFDVAECTGAGFAGSLTVTGDQPMAIHAETYDQPLPERAPYVREFSVEALPDGSLFLGWWAGSELDTATYEVWREVPWGDPVLVTDPPVVARHGPSTAPCYSATDDPGPGSHEYLLHVLAADGSTRQVLRASFEIRPGTGTPDPHTPRPEPTMTVTPDNGSETPWAPTATVTAEARWAYRIQLPWASR